MTDDAQQAMECDPRFREIQLQINRALLNFEECVIFSPNGLDVNTLHELLGNKGYVSRSFRGIEGEVPIFIRFVRKNFPTSILGIRSSPFEQAGSDRALLVDDRELLQRDFVASRYGFPDSEFPLLNGVTV